MVKLIFNYLLHHQLECNNFCAVTISWLKFISMFSFISLFCLDKKSIFWASYFEVKMYIFPVRGSNI